MLHNELWIDGDQRIRIEQSFTGGRGYRYVCDGMTKSTLAWRSQSGERPLAKIWSGAGRLDFEPFQLGIDFDLQDLGLRDARPRLRTPWMIFRPFGPASWRPEEFRLITQNAVVDNAHYVKIARMGADKNLHETYFVDPTRDDLIVFGGEFRPEVAFGNEPPIYKTTMFRLAIEYQRDRDWGFVPMRWKVNSPPNVVWQASVNTVTGLTLNETLPPETFGMNFPPGTAVIDRRTREQYVVADNGSKTNVRKFDSDKSLRILEILETPTDFTVEPQPLKDALDFLATRYQIAIRIDEKAFHQRSITDSAEVTCNESGIKLRELLTKLLQQVAKDNRFLSHPISVEFKIKNGVLVIEPGLDWIDVAPSIEFPKNNNGAK